MTGAILNATGIVVGGLFGLARRVPLSPQTQAFFKVALGVLTIFYGLRLTWLSIGGQFTHVLKQVAIALLAVMLGKLAGQLLHLQKASNRLGHYARELIERTRPDDPQRFNNGLSACAILFCASPLGFLGAVQDGLPAEAGGVGYFYPLAVKGVMDGLAMMSFVTLFGWGGMLAALPVLVLQGSLTLACTLYLEPFLRLHGVGLVDSVNAVGGLIVCTVGLVIFEIRKVELADFLPSLAVAPLLTWLWR
jgi:uncharacterized membrane protein YqgA involved in biofilm formation